MRVIFYDILVGIYFRVFRFRKNDLAGIPLKKILSRETTGVAILILTLILTTNNIVHSKTISNANAKFSNTIASDLIVSDFDTNIEEVLVKETLNPTIISYAKKKPEIDSICADKQEPDNFESETIQPSSLSFNENSDLILKPLFFDNELVATDNTQTSRTETIEYTVQLGDTVSSIANSFGLTVNTVLWANDLGNYSLIRPGNKLTIPPYSGLLYKVKSGDNLSRIASTYKVDKEEIYKYNDLTDSSSLKIGQELILPGASKIVASKPRPSKNTSSNKSPVINTSNKVPTKKSTQGSMLWPTEGRRITQYFSWAHNGLDIANRIGTPIYASEAGTVQIAATGWNGGYGNTVLINHGNGKKTRYGHLTTLYVKVGSKVEKGENIGTMGSTGRSTGPHLHFEVVINGTRYNPLNYIK